MYEKRTNSSMLSQVNILIACCHSADASITNTHSLRVVGLPEPGPREEPPRHGNGTSPQRSAPQRFPASPACRRSRAAGPAASSGRSAAQHRRPPSGSRCQAPCAKGGRLLPAGGGRRWPEGAGRGAGRHRRCLRSRYAAADGGTAARCGDGDGGRTTEEPVNE